MSRGIAANRGIAVIIPYHMLRGTSFMVPKIWFNVWIEIHLCHVLLPGGDKTDKRVFFGAESLRLGG